MFSKKAVLCVERLVKQWVNKGSNIDLTTVIFPSAVNTRFFQ
jgi:hypothetical protein